VLSVARPVPAPWVRPVEPERAVQVVPGHNRWHPGIPAVAELISGGSVRLECEAVRDLDEPLLCGPLSIVGAEPGDVIVVDILAIGRTDGRYAGAGHPGVIGCAPGEGVAGADPEGAVLGLVQPGAAFEEIAASAVRSSVRGRAVAGCAIAPLTPGSRILLPVYARGARLSVGDLRFPSSRGADCHRTGLAGWIDLRVNLTKRGVERFMVSGPVLMPDPDRHPPR